MEDNDLANKVWNGLEMLRMEGIITDINESNAMEYFKRSPFYGKKKTYRIKTVNNGIVVIEKLVDGARNEALEIYYILCDNGNIYKANVLSDLFKSYLNNINDEMKNLLS